MSALRREPSDGASRAGWVRELGTLETTRQKYEAIVSRKARLLCVFTNAARWYYNYNGQLKDSLQLEAGNRQVSEVYFPEAKHTYPLSDHRQRLIDAVCTWVKEEFSAQLTHRSAESRKSVAEAPATRG